MSDTTGLGYTDEEDPRVSDGWTVRSIEDLDWALKRIGDCRREMEENSRATEASIARLRMRLEKLNEAPARGMAFFEAHAKAYFESHKEALLPGRKRSRALPHGTVGLRKPREGLVVTDVAALVAWAKSWVDGASFVRTTEAPNLEALNKWHSLTGEVPPGTEPKDTQDVFYAKSTTEEREPNV